MGPAGKPAGFCRSRPKAAGRLVGGAALPLPQTGRSGLPQRSAQVVQSPAHLHKACTKPARHLHGTDRILASQTLWSKHMTRTLLIMGLPTRLARDGWWLESPRVAGSIPALATTLIPDNAKEKPTREVVSAHCLMTVPSGLATLEARTALASDPSRQAKVCKFFPARTASREKQRGIDRVC